MSIIGRNLYIKFLTCAALCVIGSVSSYANDKDKAPVDFAADNLTHDDQNQKIIASGNVELVQEGRIVKADKITYDLQSDKVAASGNVALTDEQGNVYFAEYLELTDSMKDGFANKIRIVLTQGDYFWADSAERSGGNLTTMRKVRYTPCKPCEGQVDERLPWSINASTVKHDKEEKTITYRDAWFEFFGVPVAYTPYFAHPDGTVEQKSGLLTPSFSFDSELGAGVETAYYWGIAPNMDATLGLEFFTDETPLVHGEFRKRYQNAAFELKGSITDSGRTERSAGREIEIDDEVRGYIEGQGLWDINDKWRAGFDLEVVSDNQYLNQYNITGEDLLESDVYVERFDGRNYGVARALFFQDLRIDTDVDQPNVLPEASASFIQDAGSFLGGRFDAEVSLLGLRREGSDQDLNRLSGELGWERRYISGYGAVTDIDAFVHGDVYSIRDRGIDDDNETESRLYPVFNWQTEYPFAKPMERFQMVFAPVAGFTAAPDLNESTEVDIPNEDSLDVQLDSSNLFEASRFPGLDRVEDDFRATYGLRTGVYGYEGSHADIFIGQSYRFDDQDNPFARGSGLSRQRSDYVGGVRADIASKYYLDYRFQLNGTSFESERHEFDATADWGKLKLSTNYLYSRSFVEDNDLDDDDDGSREQLNASLAYYLRPDWRFRMSGRYDFGENDEGLRKADFGLDYLGQCLSLTTTLRRNLTDDASGESSTEFLISIGLKNIGEFIEAEK